MFTQKMEHLPDGRPLFRTTADAGVRAVNYDNSIT
jgi:hypothetical protein